MRPKRSLSQNFLIDGNIVRKLVTAAEITPTDTILEVGPGRGAITRELLATGAHVTAVEKDELLASQLEPHPHLEVIPADILDLEVPACNKVVANLPFQVATPILTHLIGHTAIESFTVIVQREVAERYAAGPGTKAIGSISHFLQYFADVELLFRIKPTSFYPRPKIESAAVQLHRHTPPSVSNEPAFFSFLREAFSQRRKMLRRLPGVAEALARVGIREDARPEMLSLAEFIAVFEATRE